MRVFWRRWLFLVLGGALFTPYAIFAMVAVPLALPSMAQLSSAAVAAIALSLIVATIAATSVLPVVRTLEAAVAPTLLGGPAGDLTVHPMQSTDDRVRNLLWFGLHTVVGAVVSVGSVAVPPIALSLLVGAVAGEATIGIGADPVTVDRGWAAPLAVAMLAALLLLVWATGTAAARSAPRLLGPDPSTRLAELERRTRELTERTRLARELHDSIGHALTVTTLQASAARTVLHTDPEFAERALLAIEQTGRVAAADLDDFLGLLREERPARGPQPTLNDVAALVAAHEEAGLPVRLETAGDLGQVPAVVSREVYRIVQEGLTNVQRHAGPVDTAVRIAVEPEGLTVEIRNALRSRAPSRDAANLQTGGRGLAGMRERVQLLGGRLQAGPDGDDWLLCVQVPTGGRR